ncbi:MAG: cupin domain-containing protein [Planctomycetota bacterium]
MKHVNIREVPAEDVGAPAKKTRIRWLITEDDGAETFVMRHFEVDPGGHTPRHDHAWEHEVYILKGKGVVVQDEFEKPVGPGDALFVPGGQVHQFRNTGAETLEFLCLIPARH